MALSRARLGSNTATNDILISYILTQGGYKQLLKQTRDHALGFGPKLSYEMLSDLYGPIPIFAEDENLHQSCSSRLTTSSAEIFSKSERHHWCLYAIVPYTAERDGYDKTQIRRDNMIVYRLTPTFQGRQPDSKNVPMRWNPPISLIKPTQAYLFVLLPKAETGGCKCLLARSTTYTACHDP